MNLQWHGTGGTVGRGRPGLIWRLVLGVALLLAPGVAGRAVPTPGTRHMGVGTSAQSAAARRPAATPRGHGGRIGARGALVPTEYPALLPTGAITTVVGALTGGRGPKTYGMYPLGVALASAGHALIADKTHNLVWMANLTGSNLTQYGQTIRAGTIAVVAGTGTGGYSGDGGPATTAALNWPQGVTADAAGHLYIADYGNGVIREVLASTGVITTIVGDGCPATQGALGQPMGMVVDPAGNLFIADYQDNRVREVVSVSGIITTVAGTGTSKFGGDGGPARLAWLHDPQGVGLDSAGNLFIADQNNSVIREVLASTGVITTMAGNGTYGYGGDGGPATSAALNFPTSVALDGSGNLYIGDANNNRVRQVRLS